MPHKKLLFLGAIASLALLCCNKRYDPGVVAELPGPYTNVSPYEKVKPKTLSVTMSASAERSFYGNSGTRYVIPANAFMYSDSVLAVGSIQLQVAEMLTPADMFFSGVFPEANTGPLISGGEVFISAQQNGRQLFLAPGRTLQIFMPQSITPEPGMMVYEGVKSLTNDRVTWYLATDTVSSITYIKDTIRIVTDTTGFINADKPRRDTPLIGILTPMGEPLAGADSILIEIFPHDNRPVDSFQLYVVLSGTNAISPLPPTVGGRVRVRLPRRFANIIAVGFFNGYLYGDNVTKAIKGDPNFNYGLHPYRMTTQELREMIQEIK